MIVFDIPYEAISTGVWSLLMNHEPAGEFSSRALALAFALSESRRHVSSWNFVSINIEGADGKWRAFDDDVSPLKQIG